MSRTADALTKALPSVKAKHFASALGLSTDTVWEGVLKIFKPYANSILIYILSVYDLILSWYFPFITFFLPIYYYYGIFGYPLFGLLLGYSFIYLFMGYFTLGYLISRYCSYSPLSLFFRDWGEHYLFSFIIYRVLIIRSVFFLGIFALY